MNYVLLECVKIWRLPMEKLVKIFEDLMVAVTFAEAGEFDEANKIAGNEMPKDEKIPTTVPATKTAK